MTKQGYITNRLETCLHIRTIILRTKRFFLWLNLMFKCALLCSAFLLKSGFVNQFGKRELGCIFVLPVQTQTTWNAGFVGKRFLSQKTGVIYIFLNRIQKKPICCFFKSSKLDQWKPHCCWGLRFVLFVSTTPVNADSSVSSDCTVNRLSSLLVNC